MGESKGVNARNSIYRELLTQGMTQAELARKVGVRREYINRVIAEKIQPGVGFAMKIANALNRPVEQLFEVK